MTKLKATFLLSILFLLTTISAFFFEENYRKIVRLGFKLINDDKIVFIGKNFHFFASPYFVIAFGLFSVIWVLLLIKENKTYRLTQTFFTILIFIITTIITAYLDSELKIAECTACLDGRRNLNYNDINYDVHFIISLIFALLPLIVSTLPKK